MAIDPHNQPHPLLSTFHKQIRFLYFGYVIVLRKELVGGNGTSALPRNTLIQSARRSWTDLRLANV